MPIIRRTRPCITACGVLHGLCWLWLCGAGSQAVCSVWKSNSNFHTVHTACDPAPHNHSQHNPCRTPHAVINDHVLLMMGIMVAETCWDRSLIINIWLVASCWFLSLHPTFMMHGHKSLKFLVLYKAVLTCAVTSPARSLGKSVCDQGLVDHGSTLRRSSPNGKSRSWLCRNILMFHGNSLWLEHQQMIQG